MSVSRLAFRIATRTPKTFRPLSTTTPRFLAEHKERQHANTEEFRETQKSKPLGPHMTNTNSTIANEMPSIGADKAPPELLTSVDPAFTPKDSIPENPAPMTRGPEQGGPEDGANAELDVGEMEGAEFKVEPLRRTGEDANTMRARLLCPFLHLELPLLLPPSLTHLKSVSLANMLPILFYKQTRAANAEP